MRDRAIKHVGFRTRAWAVTLVVACAAGAIGPPSGVAAPRALIGPYFSAPFRVTRVPRAFGHGASWAAGGEILSTQFDRAGITQIYRAKVDGARQRCLTCRTVPGPNGLPQERPQSEFPGSRERTVEAEEPGRIAADESEPERNESVSG